ncbi:MAG: hypothetical protein Wins2KO_27470 [Winogradskyella sp.]
MKIFTLLLLFSLPLYSQVNFQKGYIIDNSNNKIECLIKNKDWKKSPEEIIYKLSDNSREEKISLSELKEFRIQNTDNFYKRRSVNKQLVGSFWEEMKLSNDMVLLRVLVEGQSDLLEVHTNGKYYFFYERDDVLVMLDYERTVDENNKIKENAKYKKQLYDNFKCKNFTLKDYSSLRYNSTKLSDFFSEYNDCMGQGYTNLHKKRTKTKIKLKLKGGMNFNSSVTDKASGYLLSYTTPPFSGSPFGEDVVRNYGGISNYNVSNYSSFGFELEMRLPFGQNNWSLFIAPNYHNIQEVEESIAFTEPNIANFEITSTLSYSFIQAPLGIRHYFDISDNLELFSQLAYSQSIIMSSSQNTVIEEESISPTPYFFRRKANMDKKSNSGGFFGIGLTYANKYMVEINYYSLGINLDDDYQMNMKGFSVNAAFTIF